jgi:Tfp pilus assembly protein PilO
MPVEVQIISIIFGSLAFTGSLWSVLHFRFKNRQMEMRGSNAESGPVVDALRDDVEQLADIQEHTRAQLAEMQERLDFAERLLTAGRASQDEKGR